MEIYFPGCTRAEASERPQREGFETWEERQEIARQERRAELREKWLADDAVKDVLQILGGELSEVRLIEETERSTEQEG